MHVNIYKYKEIQICKEETRETNLQRCNPLASSNQSILRKMGWEVRIYDYSIKEKTLRTRKLRKMGREMYEIEMQEKTVRTRKLSHRRVKSVYISTNAVLAKYSDIKR